MRSVSLECITIHRKRGKEREKERERERERERYTKRIFGVNGFEFYEVYQA